MVTKIEVGIKPQFADVNGETILANLKNFEISGVSLVRSYEIYYLLGDLSSDHIRKICNLLLTDQITQHFSVNESLHTTKDDIWEVEITYDAGVMDPVEESTLKGIRDLGIDAVSRVKTAKKYHLQGPLSENEKNIILEKILMNKLIQHVVLPDEEIFAESPPYLFQLREIQLLNASDEELEQISREGQLFLNLIEMKTIQAYFQKIGRNPTDIELETLAQTWSEHCVHKTFRGRIEFNGQIIDNLLKSTVMRVTQELDKPWCISVFKDNSGVIEFDDEHDVCFKVETHNHPSALEPYGGANTGIGGVIRDPLGTGLGAKPIANTDIFCFAPPDFPREKLPPGTLHPKRVFTGVHAGVRDYGNRMGIPTVNGSIFFDERYVGNPLVFCGDVGIMPKNSTEKKVTPGDLIIVIGGRTGRDGIHGATFSSGELTTESETVSSGAVQIGNPITEKKMVDTLLQARDRKLYTAITDCGAGGLSSAVGEICEEHGALVDLEKVPLKYEGLSYTEIWISEAQERMVIIVPPENERKIMKIFSEENVEATIIGTVTDTHRLQLRYQGNEVADLEMEFLHHGVPQITRKAIWQKPVISEPELAPTGNPGKILKQILSSWNVCSKEWVIRQYDHEVQGGSVLKPLVGVENDGPGDAAVVRPVLDSMRGIIISNGTNPKYGLIDPYAMAASAIDEAIRQIIAVGGSLEKIALLDNFCWGNTDKPDRLGSLVLAAQACYDIAKIYGTPFISGKDSLNNEYQIGDTSISIPPTLLISALGVTDDVTRTISMDLKEEGNLLYVIGDTKDELGGSHYLEILGLESAKVPAVDPVKAREIFQAISSATKQRLLRSCHDCSEGGIGVAIAEMCFAGGLGAEIDLSEIPSSDHLNQDDKLLFSESNSRFIAEISPENKEKFEEILRHVPHKKIGIVSAERRLQVTGIKKNLIIDEQIEDLKEAWQKTLRW